MRGTIVVPGDKSISHRAGIVGALADGTSSVSNFSDGADCQSTLSVLEKLGVGIAREGDRLTIDGRGRRGFEQPDAPLDCGNSGTTMRLMAGALAPWRILATLTGDESLLKRPMSRVIVPLELMGASIEASDEGGHPPLSLTGSDLIGIEYSPSVASAQVKSAVLLAGLGASGSTTVRESTATRDHTERMLRSAGIELRSNGLDVTVEPGTPAAVEVVVPGDFSSAAFFIAAALMRPGSRVTISSVGLNPTRTAFLGLVRRMGGFIEVDPFDDDQSREPVGDIAIEHGDLRAIEVSTQEVAESIDEVTLIALLATAATGKTVINGATELRHKESDRIRGTVEGLRAMGAMIEETADGMTVEGPTALQGARVSSNRDHRLAMMLALAAMSAEGETVVDGWEWTRISYPGFESELSRLSGKVT